MQPLFEFENPKIAKDKVVTARFIEALNLETTRDCKLELQGRVIWVVNSQSLSRVSSYFQAMFGRSFKENRYHTMTLTPTDDNMPAFEDLKAVDKFTTDGFVKYSSFEKTAQFLELIKSKHLERQLKTNLIQ